MIGIGINVWTPSRRGGSGSPGADPDVAAVLALSPSILYWRTKSPGTINRDGTGAAAVNGNLVGRIPDLSGNGRYAQATSDSARAVLDATGWTFTSDTYAINSPLARSGTQTMIIRLTRTANGQNQAPFSAVNYDTYWFTDDAIYTYVNGAEVPLTTESVPPNENTLTVIRNGSNTVVRRNGSQIGSITGVSVSGTYNALSNMPNGTQIRFMSVFPTALSGANLTAMEAYAAT